MHTPYSGGMKNLPATGAAPHKAAILAIILASYVMIVLDTSIVLTGLPRIQSELGFSDTGLAWVQSAYTLTFGGLLLLAARAGDTFGRRRCCSGAWRCSPWPRWPSAWRARPPC